MSTAASSSERAPNGRFAPGNAGGPGNPYARQAAGLRQAFLDAVQADDLAAIARALSAKAAQGDVPAARHLLSYSLGKPTAVPDPDRLDADEWQGFKDTANLMRELPHVSSAPAPSLPLGIVRTARPGLAVGMAQKFGAMLEEEPQPLPDLELADDEAPPSPNGRATAAHALHPGALRESSPPSPLASNASRQGHPRPPRHPIANGSNRAASAT